MSSALAKIGPANPILLRVVTAGGRRFRHALTRWAYLGLLIIVLLVALSSGSAEGKTNLTEAAKAAWRVYRYVSYVQLFMICLLAPVFTAGAITQERDARTYNILLSTPLTNTQILVGSLFSRLYYVLALLLSGVPVFAITQFFGGLTTSDVAMSFAIAGSTALFTGSLAMLIAVFRLGSGKTVFWFYVFNAVYLVGLWFVDLSLSPRGENLAGIQTGATTWLTGLHPFLALETVVRPTIYIVPKPEDISPGLPGVIRWYLGNPAQAYITLTTLASMLMIVPCALMLRRIAQRADISLWQSMKAWVVRKLGGGETRKKTRHVWNNPVAWREAATRAAVSGRGITRWLTILVGLAAGIVLVVLNHSYSFSSNPAENDERTRYAMLALITMVFSVAMLVAANTSASAVTRERESQTLDLLLCTPITSRYYIWGKLRGLVSFMFPFALVPTAIVAIVLGYDTFRHWGGYDKGNLVWGEAVIEMPILITAMLAWACMLGLNLSLKFSRTIVAVMATVGVLMGLCGLLGLCGFPIARNTDAFGLITAPFSPFTAISIMLNASQYSHGFIAGSDFLTTYGAPFGRTVFFIFTLVSAGVYCLLTWSMYRSMVKNFDMIIRRQHQ